MSHTLKIVLCCLAVLPAASAVRAESDERKMTVDQTHVRTWNRFARACLELHQRQLKTHQVRAVSRVGGYEGRPKYYTETSYYDTTNGRLLSQVQWERAHPDRLHTIEVYVRDARGAGAAGLRGDLPAGLSQRAGADADQPARLPRGAAQLSPV